MGKRATISEWLERAYDDCPPAEIYLREELEGLSATERERLDRHADDCPACAAERKLAAAFEMPELESSERRDVEAVARRLRRRAPQRSTGRRGLGWGSWLRLPAFQLAAAAALLLGVGLVLRDASPPPLAGRSGEIVTRSASVEPLSPLGAVGLPRILEWRPAEGAASYRVTVLAIDEAEIWQRATDTTAVEVDAELEALLRPAVSYLWQVTALDEGGGEIARSARVEFRIDPSVGGAE